MSEIELLLALLAVVALAGWAARALGLPYPIFLFAAGLGIGLIPGLPELEVEPEVIFLVFLPPLIHAAAWQASPRHLRAVARTVTLLALGLVFVTTAAVGVVAHTVVPGLSWTSALLLGALVSPTDTVAATAIFRRLGVPERVVGLVEGESLFNDGAALVLYRIAAGAAVTGSFSLGEAARDLVVVGTGGILLGLAVAVMVGEVRRRLEDPTLEIVITILTAYLAYLPAEELHLSGILAAVSSGLYLGWRSNRDFSSSTRLQAVSFWTVFIFVLESLLFILIGLAVPDVLDGLENRSLGELLWWGAAVSLAVILSRLLFTLAVGALEIRWDRRRNAAHPLDLRDRTVIGWSGMRGAVSVAAALALPLTTDAGAPLPDRDLIIFLTFATIGATLVLQGLTLGPLIRRLGVEATTASGPAKANARFRTVGAALDRVAELGFDESVSREVVERARELYTVRAQQLAGECRTGVAERSDSDAGRWTSLRLELLRVERAALIDLRDNGRVPLSVMREVERDLDLEEERLQRVRPSTGLGAGPGDAGAAERQRTPA